MVRIKGKVTVDNSLGANNVLWRYLDTAKFLDFVSNGTLFLNRADLFQDKYEGAFTQSIKHAIQTSYDVNKIEGSYEEFKKRLRERVFVNCWHKSQNDSMAMWQLYGKSTCSVAITTTVKKLEQSLNLINEKHFLSIKKVNYIKHWRDPSLNIKPYSNVFSYKVEAYSYEKEVRVILDRFDEDYENPMEISGMNIKVGISKLLRSIVVHPEAPEWYVQLVHDTVIKYGIQASVNRSMLSKDPI